MRWWDEKKMRWDEKMRSNLVRREDEVKPPRPVLLRKLIEINARPERIEPQHLPRRGVRRKMCASRELQSVSRVLR